MKTFIIKFWIVVIRTTPDGSHVHTASQIRSPMYGEFTDPEEAAVFGSGFLTGHDQFVTVRRSRKPSIFSDVALPYSPLSSALPVSVSDLRAALSVEPL